MRRLVCPFFLLLLSFSLPSLAGEVNPSIQEKPELTLYYAPWCYYCHKVINYLKRIHKQVPLKDVQNPLNKKELLAVGGKKQVPCLLIDQTPLYESAEIIAYLSAHQDQLEDIEL